MARTVITLPDAGFENDGEWVFSGDAELVDTDKHGDTYSLKIPKVALEVNPGTAEGQTYVTAGIEETYRLRLWVKPDDAGTMILVSEVYVGGEWVEVGRLDPAALTTGWQEVVVGEFVSDPTDGSFVIRFRGLLPAANGSFWLVDDAVVDTVFDTVRMIPIGLAETITGVGIVKAGQDAKQEQGLPCTVYGGALSFEEDRSVYVDSRQVPLLRRAGFKVLGEPDPE